jgi:predicted RNA-binding Zn ribbon-like protein
MAADDDVPAHLHLVESFANSVDTETGEDDLDSPPRFGRWLTAHGFPPAARHPTRAELALAVGVRTALRDLLFAHHDDGADEAGARQRLDAYAATIPLRAVFGPGPAGLAAAGPAAAGLAASGLAASGGGVPALLGEVLGAIVLAERDGSWQRLKICREDTCQAVFYDRSKNSSKTWCSMRVCGNRNKTRAYRGRLKTESDESQG